MTRTTKPTDTAPTATTDPAPKKPKRERTPPKAVPGRRIKIEIYNKMLAAYLEKQSAAYVAKTVGVAERTALRYIEHGDPERNLQPLKKRLKTINDLARQQQDYDLARARSEFQKAARAAFIKAAQRIQDMEPGELDANKIPDHLQKLMAVIERAFGEAEHTHEIRGRFAGWSAPELIAYLEEGAHPVDKD